MSVRHVRSRSQDVVSLSYHKDWKQGLAFTKFKNAPNTSKAHCILYTNRNVKMCGFQASCVINNYFLVNGKTCTQTCIQQSYLTICYFVDRLMLFVKK